MREMRTGKGSAGLALLGATGLGATLMYFLDADRGPRRRRRVTDQLVHAGKAGAAGLDSTARDLGNRARGAAAGMRSRVRMSGADDRVVEERVRSALGRVVSQPDAIGVTADRGCVTLSGLVLADELDELLGRVRSVRGVDDVDNRLDVRETAEGASALPGGTASTGDGRELSRENRATAPRLLTGLAGGALALYGTRRKGAVGALLGVAGLALLARGASKRGLQRRAGLGGGRRGVDLRKSISIDAPLDQVFGSFTEWESWPQWMSHVRSVTGSGERGAVGEYTHWVVDGPAGVPVEWDAETTELVPNERISWRSVEGSPVAHAGTLDFGRNDDGSTRVDVRMSYHPPVGAVGHAVAALAGRDPKRQMDDDLARLKTRIETGRAPRDAARPGAS